MSTAKGQRDKGHFTTDEFQEISKLIDGVTSLAKQRNKLAHAAFEFQQGGAYYFGTDTYLANFRGGAPRQKCQPRNVEEVTSRLLALDAKFDAFMRQTIPAVGLRLAAARAANWGGSPFWPVIPHISYEDRASNPDHLIRNLNCRWPVGLKVILCRMPCGTPAVTGVPTGRSGG